MGYVQKLIMIIVCSTKILLHDLSLNRRKSDWFLSIKNNIFFSTKGIKKFLKKKKNIYYLGKIIIILLRNYFFKRSYFRNKNSSSRDNSIIFIKVLIKINVYDLDVELG